MEGGEEGCRLLGIAGLVTHEVTVATVTCAMKPTGSVSVPTGSPNWTQWVMKRRNIAIKRTGWGVPWDGWRGELVVDVIKTHCVHVWNCRSRRYSISNFRRHSRKWESRVMKQDCVNTVCIFCFLFVCVCLSVRAGCLLVALYFFRQCLSLNLILAVEWGLLASKLPGPTCLSLPPAPSAGVTLTCDCAQILYGRFELRLPCFHSKHPYPPEPPSLKPLIFILGFGIAI